MKICLIHNLWGTYARGGGERVIENIAAGLRQRGYEVIVITTRPWFAKLEPVKGEYYLSSGYHSLDRWPMPLRLVWHLANILNPIKYFQVRSIFKKEKPDIVWTHNLTGLGFLIMKLAARYRHIHTVHDIQLLHPSGLMLYGHESIITTPAAKVYQAVLKLFISASATIIFPSHWIERVYLEQGFFKSNQRQVLQNPLNETIVDITQRASRQDSTGASTKFLFVGQVEAHKGITLLLEAFSKLAEPAELTIIGEGSLRGQLQQKYAGQPVVLVGRQTKEQVRAAMEAADYLVVPSVCYENQPTVIFEAQAAGLPVIASNIGGIPELIGENALCVPTAEALLSKLRLVCSGRLEQTTITSKILSVTEYLDTVIGR